MVARLGEQDLGSLALVGLSGLDGSTPLPSTGVTPGTYGDASHVSRVTIGADGRATAASSVAISYPSTMRFVQTQAVTVANTTVETTLLGTGIGSLTLPANSLQVGSTVAGVALGPHSAAASPNIQLRAYMNATLILDTGVVATHAGTNDTWEFRGWITCLSTGVSGSIEAQGFYIEAGAGAQVFGMVNTGPITINTTIAQTFDLTAQWSAASPSDTITARLVDIQSWAPPS